jgi:hypothetical protein
MVRTDQRYPAVPITPLIEGLREHIQWAREQGLIKVPGDDTQAAIHF